MTYVLGYVWILQWHGLAAANASEPLKLQRPFEVSLSDVHWREMASMWQEYFGVHDDTSPHPESWNTVREFGGPNVQLPPENQEPQTVPRKGPFTGRDVHVELSAIRNYHFDGSRGLDQLVPLVCAQGETAVYLAPARVPIFPASLDQDTAYWAIRLVHEKFPQADKHVMWQWGNEVNSADEFDLFNEMPIIEAKHKSVYDFFNEPKKADAYVENFFAPGVEAMKRASQDVYSDPDRIPVVCGSIANIFSPQSQEFLSRILLHKISGEHAPSLTGKYVWQLVNVLTVHYPFNQETGTATMQAILDRWISSGKIGALWITEEHEFAGRGPVTVVRRGMRFIDFVAVNHLNAAQTRLIWWGEDLPRPGGQPYEAIFRLGRFLGGQSLSETCIDRDGGKIYIIMAGRIAHQPSRVMLAVVPNENSTMNLGAIALQAPFFSPDEKWSGQWVRYSATNPVIVEEPQVVSNNRRLKITLNENVADASLLWLHRD